MENSITKIQIIMSLAWKYLERISVQGIQFVVAIILARLLSPSDYGIIALIMIFISLANIFVQSGYSSALIQKKDSNECDFCSVFYLSVFVATVLYVVLFLSAPLISHFYKEIKLIPVIRVLSITLFFGAINTVQNAVLSKKMQFKKLFISSLGAVIISGGVGIVLAYKGYGVWALVYQQIANRLFTTALLWFTVKWRPRLLFSFERLKSLFSYGSKLLLSSLLDTLSMDLRSLIIGKMFSAQMLGFYNRGKQFPQLIITSIQSSIQTVMLPALSAHQDNRPRVKEMVRRSIVTSSFIIFPLMFGLAAIAEPLVKILLTDKWLPCVPFLQIYCLIYALYPIHAANLQAINAVGRSDIFLKLEVIKKVITFSILGITVFFGVYAIAWGGVVSGVIGTFINAHPNFKLLNYRYKEQLVDIMPSFLLSLVIALVVYSIEFIGLPAWQTMVIQICFGGFLYLAVAWIMKFECSEYLFKTVKQILIRK